MSIRFNEENKIFQINTKNTSYMMGILAGKHLLHLYYGNKIEDTDVSYLFRDAEGPETDHFLL